MSHPPVLLKEVVEYLDPKPGSFVIDGTVNGGGHAKEILEKISPHGTLLGIDWDESLIARAKEKIVSRNSKVILISGNYAEIPEILKEKKLSKADGLLLDLGFSSEQIENSNRGFSFTHDEPLFMTYSSKQKPVAEIIRELKEQDLADIIFKFSGERYSRAIARAIKKSSRNSRIISSSELANIIRQALPKSYERGSGRNKSRIDPATRTFQALRIYANSELENLEKILSRLGDVLNIGGRAIIISFHSLEDALIKKYFQKIEKENKGKILTKKPITPEEKEIKLNFRSHSAKLRAIQII